MRTFKIFSTLNRLNCDSAHNMLKDISNDALERLYCESVEFKKRWPKAREHISDELNRRKSEQIEMIDMEHCAALDKENVAAKGGK